MRRWVSVFRPSWLVLGMVVIAFAYLCFTVLAPWQLGKNASTSRENDQIARSLNAEPVPLTSLLSQPNPSDEQWRPTTATGRYLPDRQVLARLRVVDGEPAFEVLTPFQIDGGPAVLVDRGYVRPVKGSQVPAISPPPTGTVTITARLRDAEAPASGKEPFRENDWQQVYSINTEQISALTGVALAEPYVQLMADQPGGLGVIPLPHLDAGPFLSYGIQWIAFGIIAPIGLGYFIYAEMRERRRDRERARPQAEGPPKALTTEEKLADRYGRRR